MEGYIVDVLSLLLRWLHMISGIAWNGASFYFVMLDTSLRPPKKPEDAKRGFFGELWAIRAGQPASGSGTGTLWQAALYPQYIFYAAGFFHHD